MINKQNYEIWFLDFFEGNLSKQDTAILFDFLDKTPELKEEFEKFELLIFEKVNIEYRNKNKLKQNLNIAGIDNLTEFEILAIKDLEQEISPDEKKELQSILRFYPEKEKEFSAFHKTKLIPDNSIKYENRNLLIKKQKIIIPAWIKYASAIAAVLLIIFFAWNIKNNMLDNPAENKPIANLESKIIENTNKTFGKINTEKSNNVVNNSIVQTTKKFHENLQNSVVIAKKETKSTPDFAKPDIAVVSVKLSLPHEQSIQKISKPQISLKPVNIPERIAKNEIAGTKISKEIKALTPKEILIKTVKTKLDINDNNYENILPVEIASASLEKLKIGKLEYKKDSANKRKHLALNIGKFSIERSW